MSDVELGLKVKVDNSDLDSLDKIFTKLDSIVGNFNKVAAAVEAHSDRMGQAWGDAGKSMQATTNSLNQTFSQYGQLVKTVEQANNTVIQTYVDMNGVISKVKVSQDQNGNTTSELTAKILEQSKALQTASQNYNQTGDMAERMAQKVAQATKRLNPDIRLGNAETFKSDLLTKPLQQLDALGKEVKVVSASLNELDNGFVKVTQTVQNADGTQTKWVQTVDQQSGKALELSNVLNKVAESQKKLNNASQEWINTQKIANFDPTKNSVVSKSLLGDEIKGVQSVSNITQSGDLVKFTQHLRDTKNGITAVDVEWNKLTGEIRHSAPKTNIQFEDLKSATMSWAASMKVAFERIIQWGVATTVIYGSLRALKEGVKVLGEIEQAAIGVKKVLPTDTDFSGLERGAVALAVNFGQGIAETYESMQSWARQYKDVNDIILMTNASMLAATATDIQMADSVKNLSAIMAEFELSTSKAIHVVDVFNELSNAFRTTATDVAEGLQKMGSAAHTLGMSMEMAASMVATGVESLGASGAEIGTALKTAFARITNSDTIGALGEMGIEVNNLEQVIMDMGMAWDSWSVAEQLAIAKSIGGTHHFTKIMGIMQNFDRVIEGMTMSYNSQGSAQEEAKRGLDSYQVRLGQAGAAVQKFALSNKALFEVLTSFVAGLGMVIEGVAVLNEALFGLPVMLGLAAVAFKLFGASIALAWNSIMAGSPTLAAFLAIAGIAITVMGSIRDKFDKTSISINNMNKAVQKMGDLEQQVQSLNSMADMYERLSNKLETLTEGTEEYIKIKGLQQRIEKQLLAANGENTGQYDLQKDSVQGLINKTRELASARELDRIETEKQAFAQYEKTKTNLQEQLTMLQVELENRRTHSGGFSLGGIIGGFLTDSQFEAAVAQKTKIIQEQLANLKPPEFGAAFNASILDLGLDDDVGGGKSSIPFQFVKYSENVLKDIVKESKNLQGKLAAAGAEIQKETFDIITDDEGWHRIEGVDKNVFSYIVDKLVKDAQKIPTQFSEATPMILDQIESATKALQDKLEASGIELDIKPLNIVMVDGNVRSIDVDQGVYSYQSQRITQLESLKERIDKLGLRQAVEKELLTAFSVTPATATAKQWENALDNVEDFRKAFADTFKEAMKVPTEVIETWVEFNNSINDVLLTIQEGIASASEKTFSNLLSEDNKMTERAYWDELVKITSEGLTKLIDMRAEVEISSRKGGSFSEGTLKGIADSLQLTRDIMFSDIQDKGLKDELGIIAEMDTTIAKLRNGTASLNEVWRVLNQEIGIVDSQLNVANGNAKMFANTEEALTASVEKGKDALKDYVEALKQVGSYWDDLATKKSMDTMFKNAYKELAPTQLREFGQSQLEINRKALQESEQELSRLQSELGGYENVVASAFQASTEQLPIIIKTLSDAMKYMQVDEKGIPLFGEDGIIKFNSNFKDLFTTNEEADKLGKAISDWYKEQSESVDFDNDKSLMERMVNSLFVDNPSVIAAMDSLNSQTEVVNKNRSLVYESEQAEKAYGIVLDKSNKYLDDRKKTVEDLILRIRKFNAESAGMTLTDEAYTTEDIGAGWFTRIILGIGKPKDDRTTIDTETDKLNNLISQYKELEQIGVSLYETFSVSSFYDPTKDAEEAIKEIDKMFAEGFGEYKFPISDLIGEADQTKLKDLLIKLRNNVATQMNKQDNIFTMDEVIKREWQGLGISYHLGPMAEYGEQLRLLIDNKKELITVLSKEAAEYEEIMRSIADVVAETIRMQEVKPNWTVDKLVNQGSLQDLNMDNSNAKLAEALRKEAEATLSAYQNAGQEMVTLYNKRDELTALQGKTSSAWIDRMFELGTKLKVGTKEYEESQEAAENLRVAMSFLESELTKTNKAIDDGVVSASNQANMFDLQKIKAFAAADAEDKVAEAIRNATDAQKSFAEAVADSAQKLKELLDIGNKNALDTLTFGVTGVASPKQDFRTSLEKKQQELDDLLTYDSDLRTSFVDWTKEAVLMFNQAINKPLEESSKEMEKLLSTTFASYTGANGQIYELGFNQSVNGAEQDKAVALQTFTQELITKSKAAQDAFAKKDMVAFIKLLDEAAVASGFTNLTDALKTTLSANSTQVSNLYAETESLTQAQNEYLATWRLVEDIISNVNTLEKENKTITYDKLLKVGEIKEVNWEPYSVAKRDTSELASDIKEAQSEQRKLNDEYLKLKEQEKRWMDSIAGSDKIDSDKVKKDFADLFGANKNQEYPTEKLDKLADALKVTKDELLLLTNGLKDQSEAINVNVSALQSLIAEYNALAIAEEIALGRAEELQTITDKFKEVNTEAKQLAEQMNQRYEAVVRFRFQLENPQEYADKMAKQELYEMPSLEGAVKSWEGFSQLEKTAQLYEGQSRVLDELANSYKKAANARKAAENDNITQRSNLQSLIKEQERLSKLGERIKADMNAPSMGNNEALANQLWAINSEYGKVTNQIDAVNKALDNNNATINTSATNMDNLSEQHRLLTITMGHTARVYGELTEQEERHIHMLELQQQLGDIWQDFAKSIMQVGTSVDLLGPLEDRMDAFGNAMKKSNGEVIQLHDSLEAISGVADRVQESFNNFTSDSMGKMAEFLYAKVVDDIKSWTKGWTDVEWKETEEMWGKGLTNLMKLVSTKLSGMGPLIGSLVTSWWGILFNIFSTDNWSDALDNLLNGFEDGFVNIVDVIGRIIEHLPEMFVRIFTKIIETLPEMALHIIKAFSEAILGMPAVIVKMLPQIGMAIVKGLRPVLLSLPNIIGAVLLGSAMKIVLAQFIDYVIKGFAFLKVGITSVMSGIQEVITTILSKAFYLIKGWFVVLGQALLSFMQTLWAIPVIGPILAVGGTIALIAGIAKLGQLAFSGNSKDDSSSSSSDYSSGSGTSSYTAGSNVPITYNNYITITSQAFMGDEEDARQFAVMIGRHLEEEESRSA